MSTTEKFLSPKELAAMLFELHGVTTSARFMRAMLQAGVKPRLGYNARLSDLITFWAANPDFVARPKTPQRHRKHPKTPL